MWAPDGQSLAYVTDRTGAANIFLFDFTKNEQYQLTDVIGSVMSFRNTTNGLPGCNPIQEAITRMKIAIERMMERMKTKLAAASIGLSS